MAALQLVTHRDFRPLKYALLLAACYLVFGSLYIVVSGLIVSERALSQEELAALERIKGLVYMGVTSIGVFALGYVFLRALARKNEAYRRQRESFLNCERRATVGLLAATAAHDCRNLMVVLSTSLSLLDEHASESDTLRELLPDMRTAVRQITEMLQRLQDTGRSHLGPPQRIDLASFVDEQIPMLARHERIQGRELTRAGEGAVWLYGFPALVQCILLNLVLNAAEAVERPGGRIEVRARPTDDGALLEVHDDGAGIPEAERDEVLQPEASSKGSHRGLGLFSARLCADAHGGDVALDDSPLGGACIRVSLRSLEDATAPDEATDEAPDDDRRSIEPGDQVAEAAGRLLT